MQKIRILIYTDHLRIVDKKGVPKGVTDLITFIQHKAKELVEVEITAINRHVSLITKNVSQGANKLSWGLVSGFDEIWIFGTRQLNRTADEPAKAEPYNELDEHEIAVLESWMNAGGGLMFTGDHSEPNPTIEHRHCAEPGHLTFINLGAALGSSIPRAKDLRVWKGPPTYCPTPPRDNVNTQEKGKCFGNLDTSCHQYDDLPQVLLPISPPHKLFLYRNADNVEVPITVLPDHMHEGKVLVPLALDNSWPKDSLFPVIAARGVDKRKFPNGETREYDLVVAYDGHPHQVGRIVADSSFHHFINVNLQSIQGRTCCGTPIPDTHLDQIAHYFMNLVLWLAPKSKREAIKSELWFRLAKHADVLEARGSGIRGLGQAARSVASMEWGDSNLHQLLTQSDGDKVLSSFDRLLSMAFPADYLSSETEDVNCDDFLGTAIAVYHHVFEQEQIHSPEFLDEDPLTVDLLVEAVVEAFRNQSTVMQKIFAPVEPAATNLTEKGDMTMAFICGPGTWESFINDDEDGIIDAGPILDEDGNFTGVHDRPLGGGRPRPVLGKCFDRPRDRIRILSFEGEQFHLYFGTITEVDGVPTVERGNGTHRMSPVPFPPLRDEDWDFRRSKRENDDDWVAVKTT